MLNFPPFLACMLALFSPPKFTPRDFAGNKSLIAYVYIYIYMIILYHITSKGALPTSFTSFQSQPFSKNKPNVNMVHLKFDFLVKLQVPNLQFPFLSTSGENLLRSLWHSITLVGWYPYSGCNWVAFHHLHSGKLTNRPWKMGGGS